MAAQMGHNHEETQSSPPPRIETKVSGYNKKTSLPTQTEKQKKQEILVDLSTDIKKIKPPKFVGFESGEDAEVWLTKME